MLPLTLHIPLLFERVLRAACLQYFAENDQTHVAGYYPTKFLLPFKCLLLGRTTALQALSYELSGTEELLPARATGLFLRKSTTRNSSLDISGEGNVKLESGAYLKLACTKPFLKLV